jgi:predicted ATPase
MAKSNNARGPRVPEPRAITEIQVAGFKSISKEQRIEIRPLTILAGANSSG